MQPLTPDDPRSTGEFRLSARLGLGGMGRVFLGYSPAGRAVAVKVCHPDLAANPEFVRRFAREVAAAQAVNGLYTAQVVAAGPYDNPPWLATDYIPGPSLQDYVDSLGPLPEPAVWRLATGLAEALQAVHASGLVHRDLKPTNVLLATDGPRVIDFGIASALDATALTTAGTTLGSPSYMSPEQALGSPVGPASDVFALGSTVAFAATGGAPFGGGDAPAVLFRVVHTEPALDLMPERLRAVVAACLAKDPAGRPTLPQLLHACQAAAAAWGGSATSFWPTPVTAAIARYQARPVRTPPPTETVPSGGPAAGTTWPPTSRRSGTTAARAVGRRRMLAGLGGLAAAGALAAGGTTPTRVGDYVYAGSDDHYVYALDAGTGQQVWRTATGGPVRSGPVEQGQPLAGYGVVWAGSEDGAMYALNAVTGTVSWRYATGSAIYCGPLPAPGGAYFGSDNGRLYCLDYDTFDDTKHVLLQFSTGGAIRGTPAYAGETLYVGSATSAVYAIGLDTGRAIWRYLAGSAVNSRLAVGGVVLYAGSDDGYLHAIDITTGTALWRYRAGGPIQSGIVVAGGLVYFGSTDHSVYALHA